ncbi:hypothetical protein QJQ45_020901 [Haematococcus lacustris]|nr:hypothetical protein QJQ45_020901 [Haematococcus lacustris]
MGSSSSGGSGGDGSGSSSGGSGGDGSSSSSSIRLLQWLSVKMWLVPFRAVWGPAADCVAVGSMSRGVDLFTPDCAYKVGSLAEGELMKSIVSRLAFHPHCHALAAANGSGRLHVWR